MRVLVIAADGFIGRSVESVFSTGHNVYGSSRVKGAVGRIYLDLADPSSIIQALKETEPQVIINCAGVVENTKAASANVTFTSNLLESIAEVGHKPKRVVICGSAAEYGLVDKKNIPVTENTPLNATSEYGLSKLSEAKVALKYKKSNRLPVVIARIFNPVGAGMPSRLLLPNLIKQIKEFKAGARRAIEVSRLDTMRDYIDIRDVASALKALSVDSNLEHDIYNVGSGRSTSTKQLLKVISDNFGFKKIPKVVETSSAPEGLVAIRADISRIRKDTGWAPTYTVKESLEKIFHDSR